MKGTRQRLRSSVGAPLLLALLALLGTAACNAIPISIPDPKGSDGGSSYGDAGQLGGDLCVRDSRATDTGHPSSYDGGPPDARHDGQLYVPDHGPAEAGPIEAGPTEAGPKGDAPLDAAAAH